MSPNRIVALITPVCALAAGWAASWLADNVPGLNISQENLQAVFITGALAVMAPALHWLHGWQKYEARQAEDERLAGVADAAAAMREDEAEELDELDDLDVELTTDELEDLEDLEDLDDELAVEEPVAPR